MRCCALVGVLASLSHGCTDPGCIRNSECEENFRCLEQVCTRSGADAGVTPAPTTPDASTQTPIKRDAAKPTPASGDDAGSE